ncbi:hypothetical protein DEO72_LG6g1094 [Vigna unguiculata]|uniref:Uncharacterized protein n=1 Tax=Vigna unguiculata TaxID=3917 RepID=A0A4D6M528_VIGUN|nr:hypothetical protein DEO72_LG6g1094 [Vigna unguiculata]
MQQNGQARANTYSSYSQMHYHHPISIYNQAYYDSSFNTLRLDSTHPDTYNLVGFSGCLHLWWIPQLNPELLISELCVTSVTMNQISLTTRSQSALSETNWPLRVSGCSHCLESLPSYTDGAPPWTPTNRGHGITSRPLKRDPGGLT